MRRHTEGKCLNLKIPEISSFLGLHQVDTAPPSCFEIRHTFWGCYCPCSLLVSWLISAPRKWKWVRNMVFNLFLCSPATEVTLLYNNLQAKLTTTMLQILMPNCLLPSAYTPLYVKKKKSLLFCVWFCGLLIHLNMHTTVTPTLNVYLVVLFHLLFRWSLCPYILFCVSFFTSYGLDSWDLPYSYSSIPLGFVPYVFDYFLIQFSKS